MDLSIVFSTYKSEAILEKSLQAYSEIETEYDWELIIVDNANRQETRDVIAAYRDKLPLTFIEKSEPGKNNALNRALPIAKGDLFFFTDNDVVFSKNIIDVAIQSAEKYKEYDIFTGKILPDIDLPDWIDLSSFRVRSAFVVSDRGDEDLEIAPADVWGPNMVVRRELFDNGLTYNPNVGPNGKSYAMGSETELLRRLEANGHKAMYLADSKVLHQIRAEQLSIDWLKHRTHRLGRGVANHGDDGSVLLFGAPRYLVKCIVVDWLKLVTAVLLFKNKKLLNKRYMDLYFNLGKYAQHKSLRKS